MKQKKPVPKVPMNKKKPFKKPIGPKAMKEN